ncbi:hypothetical protein AB1N83_008022 [Pleurotus pulmonarius]
MVVAICMHHPLRRFSNRIICPSCGRKRVLRLSRDTIRTPATLSVFPAIPSCKLLMNETSLLLTRALMASLHQTSPVTTPSMDGAKVSSIRLSMQPKANSSCLLPLFESLSWLANTAT